MAITSQTIEEAIGKIDSLRDSDLLDTSRLEQLVFDLGLYPNDPYYPPSLAKHAGGMQLWQYPQQFGPYLKTVALLKPAKYVELGVASGGTLIVTMAIIHRATGQWPRVLVVDTNRPPEPVVDFVTQRGGQIVCTSTASHVFTSKLDSFGHVDLVLIDACHEEAYVRQDTQLMLGRASVMAFHDISNHATPGVRAVWDGFMNEYPERCIEFVGQSEDAHERPRPYMGIGIWVTGLSPLTNQQVSELIRPEAVA